MLQKYAIMLLSKIIFLGHKNTFSHRTVTKHIERLQNSRTEASSSSTSSPSLDRETVVNLVPEAIRQATSTTTELVAFGHFFLSSHVEIFTAHAQYARG